MRRERPPESTVTHNSVGGQKIVSAYAPVNGGWTVGVAADPNGLGVGPKRVSPHIDLGGACDTRQPRVVLSERPRADATSARTRSEDAECSDWRADRRDANRRSRV